MLAPLGLESIIQPAFEFLPTDPRRECPDSYAEFEAANSQDLVIFTSPRAVMHGLAQLPRDVFLTVRIAAIGPATASALAAAGLRGSVTPADGFTSEALLETLAADPARAANGQRRAFILAAPGGRQALAEGLATRGWRVRMLLVYRSEPAKIDQDALAQLQEAAGVLAVWTSGNTMNALSQRLPPATWFRLCLAEWLVISERLQRLARAYGPARIHLAGGPGNGAILASIRSLM